MGNPIAFDVTWNNIETTIQYSKSPATIKLNRPAKSTTANVRKDVSEKPRHDCCTCPNCLYGDRKAGRRKHNCHFLECTKEYKKKSHLRRHLKTHKNDHLSKHLRTSNKKFSVLLKRIPEYKKKVLHSSERDDTFTEDPNIEEMTFLAKEEYLGDKIIISDLTNHENSKHFVWIAESNTSTMYSIIELN